MPDYPRHRRALWEVRYVRRGRGLRARRIAVQAPEEAVEDREQECWEAVAAAVRQIRLCPWEIHRVLAVRLRAVRAGVL